MSRLRLFIVLALVACICNISVGNIGGHGQSQAASIILPVIPDSLIIPSERADYLAIHFWDNLDFTDTVLSHSFSFLEQSFVDYLSVLPHASSLEVVQDGFKNLLSCTFADSTSFRMLTELGEVYLDGRNSPMRSEDQYICFLSALCASHYVNEATEARIKDRINMLNKNRKGTQATDFVFLTREGIESTLYSTLPENDSLLWLLFFDPSCETCDEVMKRMISDRDMNQKFSDEKIKILAVYSGDNVEAWIRKAQNLPAGWTVGINPGDIDEDELYYLPQMPTIYILDANGIVIDRDIKL